VRDVFYIEFRTQELGFLRFGEERTAGFMLFIFVGRRGFVGKRGFVDITDVTDVVDFASFSSNSCF
jgi:hypothetical protein